MKKIGFIIGSVEVILGLVSLLVTSLISQVIPKIAIMYSIFVKGGGIVCVKKLY